MSETRAMRFTEDHEWLRSEQNGLVTIGITDHAQDQLGDVVFVQLPEIGARFGTGDEAVVIESVKAAGEIRMPGVGEVVAVNGALVDAPAKVNQDPLGEGWFLQVRLEDPSILGGLMDEAAYRAYLG
jgi:glycine cleavage system H protein